MNLQSIDPFTLDKFKYPFKDSKKPEIDRLTLDYTGPILGASNFLYPDIISSVCIYHHGLTKEEWNEEIRDLYIYCSENNIGNICIAWNRNERTMISVDIFWKIYWPMLYDWSPLQKYNIGNHICITKNLRYTLEMLPPILPFQIFLTSPKSNAPPKLDASNLSCMDIISNKRMSVFVHGTYTYNLARPGHSVNVRKYLEVSTAHGFKGVVFHVGTATNMTKQEAYQNMGTNIIESLSYNTCPFILETCAGEGNSIIFDIIEFCNFCKTILSYNRGNFGVCIDTCHVFASGYDPYRFLKYVLEQNIPVYLIHYNDSKYKLGQKKDRHAAAGSGYIPWVSLEKCAKLAFEKGIPMVCE